MPGTLPNIPAPARVRLESNWATLVSYSINLKRQARSQNTQRYRLQFVYPPGLQWAEVKTLFGFLQSQRGQADTFSVAIPEFYNTGITAAGTFTSGAGSSVTLGGLPPGSTVLPGDMIKFAGHDKLYCVGNTVTVDGAGEATAVTIAPALLEQPAAGAVVTPHTKENPITGTFALSSDELIADMTLAQRVGFRIDMVEIA